MHQKGVPEDDDMKYDSEVIYVGEERGRSSSLPCANKIGEHRLPNNYRDAILALKANPLIPHKQNQKNIGGFTLEKEYSYNNNRSKYNREDTPKSDHRQVNNFNKGQKMYNIM